MRHVVLQNLFLDAAQRRPNGRDLRDHVDAVAVVLDHAGEAPHLALDAAQPLAARGLDFVSHARLYTPTGYRCQGAVEPWQNQSTIITRMRMATRTTTTRQGHRRRATTWRAIRCAA